MINHTPLLSLEDARALAGGLVYVTDRGLTLRAKVIDDGDNSRVVLVGGRFGETSLSLSHTTEDRLLNHWHGYMQANSDSWPEPQFWPTLAEVVVPRGTRSYDARPIRWTAKRVLAAHRYVNGRLSAAWFPRADLGWNPRKREHLSTPVPTIEEARNA